MPAEELEREERDLLSGNGGEATSIGGVPQPGTEEQYQAAIAKTASEYAPKDPKGNQCPEGSFSIRDWNGYPNNLPKPTGPFRFLSGEEYAKAREAANRENQRLHQNDPNLAGQQIHEIQPVKFGGSPTDPDNKIPLSQENHAPATVWWNQLKNRLQAQ